MRALATLAPVFGIAAAASTIYWNVVMRKRLMEARIAHLSRNTVESKYARVIRYGVTTLVALFAASLLILGMVIIIKTLWTLFS